MGDNDGDFEVGDPYRRDGSREVEGMVRPWVCTPSGVTGAGGSVMYAAVGSEIIGVDVSDVEKIKCDREGTEEDIVGSGVGEENMKVGSDCG